MFGIRIIQVIWQELGIMRDSVSGEKYRVREEGKITVRISKEMIKKIILLTL